MAHARKTAIAAVLLVSVAAHAQSINLPETRNAALRYWQAFALMQDPQDFDRALANKIMNGDSEWDEARLGPLIDRNTTAIETMQQATLLPECDWGLDYSAALTAPNQHRSKGRALAELNLLYGIRALAKHDAARAAKAFAAGIRFAQHLGQDSTVIGILTASTFGLEMEYSVIDKLTDSGRLDSETKAELDEAIRSLPKFGGFQWAQAVRVDGFALEQELKHQAEQMKASRDPRATAKLLFHETPPESISSEALLALFPSTSDLQQFHSYIDDLANACELPADAARTRLDHLQATSGNLNPIAKTAIPNLVRFCLDRERLEEKGEALLQRLEKQ
jgi:hypothetical protein